MSVEIKDGNFNQEIEKSPSQPDSRDIIQNVKILSTAVPSQLLPSPEASILPYSENVGSDIDIEQEVQTSEEPVHSTLSKGQKRLTVFMVTIGGIFSPISASIYLPALNTISTDLRVSASSINLTITSYMIFQALAPMFFGNFSDSSGRRPTYIICYTIYICANLGLALQDNYVALFILRAMQSTGSSGTIALASGVMADIVTSAERGEYVGWTRSGLQLGSALGPTLGGILSEYLGWRAIFWFLLIASATYLLLYIVLVPETGRNVVGNGSIPATGVYLSLWGHYQQRRSRKGAAIAQTETKRSETRLPKKIKFRFPNPLQTLRIVLEKDVGCILFYTSLLNATFFCLLVPLSRFLANIYGYNNLQIGLCFLPYSGGAAVGSVLGGRFIDYNFKRTCERLGLPVDKKRMRDLRDFPIEKARLQVIIFPLIIGIGGVIGMGWIIQFAVHIAALLIFLFIIGLFLSAAMSMSSTLIVDLYPQSPSTATAALNLTRCSMSAAATAVIQYILDKLGIGWTYTFLGFLCVIFLPSLYIVMRWGPGWREERRVRYEKRREKKEVRRQADARGP